jgi:Fe-S cluster assembly ATP-binding protein
MLEIKNLHARIAEDGTEIIRGPRPDGEGGRGGCDHGAERIRQVDAVLHSRRPRRLRGHRGRHLYNGESILEMDPAERAAAGMFLAFQYPMEIPGVATMQFLKVAMNEQRKARGEAELTTPDFIRLVKEAAGSSTSRWKC